MTFELRGQPGELLEQLDELQETIAALTAWLQDFAGDDEEDAYLERRERLAWLHRQQAGVLIILGETERALLASGD